VLHRLLNWERRTSQSELSKTSRCSCDLINRLPPTGSDEKENGATLEKASDIVISSPETDVSTSKKQQPKTKNKSKLGSFFNRLSSLRAVDEDIS
jgi:hypothetical protein